jgi:DNA invertase Pin-like site-specific DNA recombinase
LTNPNITPDRSKWSAPVPGISYARVSSEKQLSGEGLTRQLKGTIDWLAAHPEYPIRLDLTLTDEARSAWKGDHLGEDGAFGKLLEMVRAGAIKRGTVLMVEALDRLSRQDVWKATHQLTGLVTAGITVITTRDSKIYSNDSRLADKGAAIGDLIMSVVIMANAHDESEKKSYRISETKAKRAIEAQTTKNVLHQNTPGWLIVADAASANNRATRKYKKIDRHVETVCIIFSMALDHGAAFITRWLIDEKVEPFGRSGKWNIRYVKNILASRAPLGHLETKQGLIENILPQVIDDDLWSQVQAACKARTGKGGAKHGGAVNLLAGIGRCADCGGNMRINQHGGTHRRYYECTNHAVLRTCKNRCRYRVDVIEQALMADFGWLTIVEGKAAVAPNMAGLEANVVTLKAREQRLATRLKALDDDEMFDTIMAQLRALRRDLSDAITELSAAKQASAVAAVPIQIANLVERDKLATALRQLVKGAYFDQDNEVGVLSTGGLMLIITARQDGPAPRLMMLRRDGVMAMIQAGKLTIADSPSEIAAAGMTFLDAKTINDLAARLAEP